MEPGYADTPTPDGVPPQFDFTLTRERDVVGQLVDHTLILSIESQTELIARYSGLPWRVDLAEPPVFWFERQPAAAMFRPHFIGSVSTRTNTWLWAWENINHFPKPVVALARHVRAVGERLGVAELTAGRHRTCLRRVDCPRYSRRRLRVLRPSPVRHDRPRLLSGTKRRRVLLVPARQPERILPARAHRGVRRRSHHARTPSRRCHRPSASADGLR